VRDLLERKARGQKTTQAIAGDEAADEFCEGYGYEPELKRSLNGFQMFAIAFASMSVVRASSPPTTTCCGTPGRWGFGCSP